eukprot:13622003-Ditylum_brightwellii.AAC.1
MVTKAQQRDANNTTITASDTSWEKRAGNSPENEARDADCTTIIDDGIIWASKGGLSPKRGGHIFDHLLERETDFDTLF